MAPDPDEDLFAAFEQETATLLSFLETPDLFGWDPTRPRSDHPEYRRRIFLDQFSREMAEILSSREFLLVEGETAQERLEELVVTVRRLNKAWIQDTVALAFPGEWVAIDGYHVLDHDADLAELLARTARGDEGATTSIYHAVQPETA